MKFYKSCTTSSDRTNTHHKHQKSDLIMIQEIKKKTQKKLLLFKKYLNSMDCISIRLHQNPLPAVRNSEKNLHPSQPRSSKVKIIFHLLQKKIIKQSLIPPVQEFVYAPKIHREGDTDRKATLVWKNSEEKLNKSCWKLKGDTHKPFLLFCHETTPTLIPQES